MREDTVEQLVSEEEILKIRTLTSLALAGGLAIAATGCSLIAPIATTNPYNTGDGVRADAESVNVRNLLVVADETGGTYNVVFTAVNNESTDQNLAIDFVTDDGTTESVETEVPTGTTVYGKRDGDTPLLTVDLGDQAVGSTVEAFLSSGGSEPVRVEMVVLDGTLAEYEDYVVTESDLASEDSAA